MKVYILIWLLSAACLSQAQDRKRVFRINLAPSLGLGVSGNSDEMTGGALMGALALPLEFGKQWYLIPEVYAGDFRSPRYPYKLTHSFSDIYPVLRHGAYAVRLGKGFKIKGTIPVLSFRFSVGAGLLRVHEPRPKYIINLSKYDEVLYRTWVVPAQLDLRFRLTKRERSFFIFGGRWDANGHRHFGSLNAGLEMRLWSTK